MILEPRKRFHENQIWVKSHQDLVVNTQFRAALEAALAQMALETPDAHSPEEAAAYWKRMEGAREFILYLMNLAENPKIPPMHRTPNLNHTT